MQWRSLVSLVGGVLAVAGAASFAIVVSLPHLPSPVAEPIAAVIEPAIVAVMGEPPASRITHAVQPPAPGDVPITRLVIPSIGLDTRVVTAPEVERDGVITWDVPKFVAGHAEGSPGAGQAGNTILIGHLTSISLGNVFEHLDQVSVGDAVQLYNADASFEYRVADVQDVARTDVSVLDPTPAPSLTLITCSGLWLPTFHDYNQRLVVRAVL
jgi:LPXTG-site transpeptidase (sortase) family protein